MEKPLTTRSETCKINTSTFDYGQPEELLVLLRNFKIEIDRTGTTTASGQINYLHTMIRGKSLRELDKLALVGNSITNHLPHEGFTWVLPPSKCTFHWYCPSPSRTPSGSFQDFSITPTGYWASIPSPWPSIPATSRSPCHPYFCPIFSYWPRWWRQQSCSKICPLLLPISPPPSVWGPSHTFLSLIPSISFLVPCGHKPQLPPPSLSLSLSFSFYSKYCLSLPPHLLATRRPFS